jgi:hypothetical protein
MNLPTLKPEVVVMCCLIEGIEYVRRRPYRAYKYCDVASESRILWRPSLDNGLLKIIAKQRSVNTA